MTGGRRNRYIFPSLPTAAFAALQSPLLAIISRRNSVLAPRAGFTV